MAAVAVGELLVVVLAEEARQRVPHARQRAILGEVLRPASAAARFAGGLLEDVVIDVVTPQETRQSGQTVHGNL